jgi:hypothetical protein
MWSPETNALAGLAPRELGPEAITAYQQFKSIYA